MRILVLALVLVIADVSVSAAQTTQSDEQQIRGLIAKYDSGQQQGMFASDRVFWSGALKRPIVGSQQGEEVPGDRRLSERVPGSQRNTTTVRRIEVAKSGDLAYEFSDSVIRYELKDGTKGALQNSTLRVWRKEAGQWKIAAHFARPHYQDLAK